MGVSRAFVALAAPEFEFVVRITCLRSQLLTWPFDPMTQIISGWRGQFLRGFGVYHLLDPH